MQEKDYSKGRKCVELTGDEPSVTCNRFTRARDWPRLRRACEYLAPSSILKEMPQNLIERLKQSPVLCDGAMGTLLYAKGIFINRCYDELNVSQPELIRAVHHDYLQAGAEIIETNTFGANSFRLARHSIADRVRDINLAGAHVAREAAKSFDVWVAGSIGPLGVRIEPLGKTSFEEARTAFREQVAALGRGWR